MAAAGEEYYYGLDAELKKKQDAKMDSGLQARAIAFIHKHTGEEIAPEHFQERLKDGQILCALANALWAGSVTGVSKSSMPFNQMENISKYLAAVTAHGVKTVDLFQTVDLYEAKNIPQVIHNIVVVDRLMGGEYTAATLPKQVPLGGGGGKSASQIPTAAVGAHQGAVETIDRSRGVGGTVKQGVANDDCVYGLDKELTEKKNAKYTPEARANAKAIIERISGVTLGSDDLHEELKSGVVLCKMANAVRAGVCPEPKASKMPFIQMENISHYLSACQALGIGQSDMFQTVDLFEGSNLPAVIFNIEAFARKTGK